MADKEKMSDRLKIFLIRVGLLKDSSNPNSIDIEESDYTKTSSGNYELSLNNSDEYDSVFSILNKNKYVDEDNDGSSQNEHNSTIIFDSNEQATKNTKTEESLLTEEGTENTADIDFTIILQADFDNDVYNLIVKEN